MCDFKDFFWKCPQCNEEQIIRSPYFILDCGARERCYKCNKEIYCHHPSSPFPKKEGEITAYIKD